MSSATRENVQLLRAVVKHPVLYDRGDENYRKRLPSENSWDLVASEVGGSVEKCKRRWRQLRNDYIRWCNADAARRRQGQRRLIYPLHDEFRFLDRHLNLAGPNNDEEPSGSEKDRDSNRDSESRDISTASVKGDAAGDDKSVNDESLVAQLVGEDDPPTKDEDKDKTKETPNANKGSQEKSVEKKQEPERSHSYLQSDQEDEEPIEEEHLEQLEDLELEEEEELAQEKEKESSENSKDSPASQSEFFIKQNKEPHLLIIGKKNATRSGSEATEAEGENMNLEEDPLDDEIAMEASYETAAKYLRRRDSTHSPSRRLRRVKDVPIKKSTLGQRVTRHQRTKSMSLAAGQSIRSSTSPVKMTPVPRPVGGSKTVQVKKTVPPKDGYFSRPEPPAAEGKPGPKQSLNHGQPQKQPMVRRLTTSGRRSRTPTTPPKRGRPPKKIEMAQRLVSPPIRQQTPSTSKVLPSVKPSASTVNTGTNMANKGSNTNTNTNTTPNLTKRVTAAANLKPLENITVMSYSPISGSNASSAGSNVKSISKGSPSSVATSTPAASQLPPSMPKRCERPTQTDSPDMFSNEHFLNLIRPSMEEMNTRQKMHFKQKVFKALMEVFDDATDFPEAGELQHFNINTPSGFEHVTTPELRLIRELVSMVSAAKVSPRAQPPQPAKIAIQPPLREAMSSDSQRVGQTLSIPSRLIQKVVKPVPRAETTANNVVALGGERAFRIMKAPNGKPNGISASLEDLCKDSVDSEHSAVNAAHVPPASPKGATVATAVRPQGSPMNNLFGPPSNVTAVKTGPSLKDRAMARRFSTCNNPASSPINQNLGYPSSLHANLTPMEANALKRRLMAPAQAMTATQRPRYAGVTGIQQIVTPQGHSLLVRKPMGASPGVQKQQVSPTGGVHLTPQKTPQITNVQGAAFKDFAQPKPTAAAAPATSASSASSASPAASEANPQSTALKRSLVVANAKSQLVAEGPANKPQQQPQVQKTNSRYSSMTAATIAADDFSLANLKREPMDHIDDHDDILGI